MRNGPLDHTPEGGGSGGAPLDSPTFTGIPAAPTAAPGTDTTQIATTGFVKAAIDVALAFVDGVTDAISAALSAHAARTDNPHAVTKSQVGLANADNTADTAKPVSTAQQTALDLKAPLASPTFTGTVAGITKSMVGLGNADNTSDANKPVSTAQQTALNLKAPLASPTFTGIVTTAGQVAFPAVQNPSADANTLDDYEEGSFTPTLSFDDLSVGITYSVQVGRYVKIGSLVTAFITMALSSKGSSVGPAQITLPFLAKTVPNNRWAAAVNFHNLTGTYSALALTNHDKTWLYKGIVRAADTDFANDSQFNFTLQYEAAN